MDSTYLESLIHFSQEEKALKGKESKSLDSFKLTKIYIDILLLLSLHQAPLS